MRSQNTIEKYLNTRKAEVEINTPKTASSLADGHVTYSCLKAGKQIQIIEIMVKALNFYGYEFDPDEFYIDWHGEDVAKEALEKVNKLAEESL